MAKAKLDPTKEIGVSGLRAYGGYVNEEFLPELRGTKAIAQYRQMASNDAVIGAMLFAMKALASQVEWHVTAVDDSSAADEAEEFVEDVLFDGMDHPFADAVKEALTMLEYGFAPLETVYQRRKKDGKIGLRKLALRSQDTVQRWDIDDAGQWQGFWQQPPSGHLIYIPADRVLLFRTEPNRGNPEGRSILRNAWRSWKLKTRIEEIEGIGVERDLAGLPVVRVPGRLMEPEATPEEMAQLAAWEMLARNIKRDRQEGVVLPNDRDDSGNYLYDVSLLSAGGSRQFDTSSIIDRYDRRIAATVLADFIFLGQGSTGSWALAQPLISKVLTPAGWTTMGEVHVGDRVICPLGFESRVIDTFDHGVRQCYRVTLGDGRVVLADADHKWVVTTSYWKRQGVSKRPRLPWAQEPPEQYEMLNRYGVLTTQQIMQRMKDGDVNSRFHVPITSPVNFGINEAMPVDPYILGVLLGDGYIPERKSGNGGPVIICADKEIADEVSRRLPPNYHLSEKKTKSRAIRYTISGSSTGYSGSNVFTAALDNLGLTGAKAINKFIPPQYLTASVNDRLWLLRGLMDTDGHANGQIQFTTISPRLRDGVMELVRGLGGIASTFSKVRDGYQHPINKEFVEKETVIYRVTIKMPANTNPFFLHRKAVRVADKVFKTEGTGIVSIEAVDSQPMRCIMVSSPSHLYITDDYTPTHNSSDKTALFGVALGSFLKIIRDQINRVLLPRLWTLNGMKPETMPWIDHGDIETPNLSELGNFVSNLSRSGMMLFPDQQLENTLRKMAGLPEAPERDDEDMGGMDDPLALLGLNTPAPAPTLPAMMNKPGELPIPGEASE